MQVHTSWQDGGILCPLQDETESILFKSTNHLEKESLVLLSNWVSCCYGRTQIKNNNEAITKPSEYQV